MTNARKNLFLMNHPLILHKISMLRNADTPTKEFRRLLREISLMIGYEATRDLPLKTKRIQTPLEETEGRILESSICLVPILRAGLGMTDALLELIPQANVGHIGMYRDHDTYEAVEYYFKLPANISESCVYVLDPMLATGNSATAAVNFLKKENVKTIKMINIVGAPQGVESFCKAHPDVDVYLGILDRDLNANAYILPGLGDAGDRLFGTL